MAVILITVSLQNNMSSTRFITFSSTTPQLNVLAPILGSVSAVYTPLILRFCNGK
jgi:hypothetical protein